jgi:hypothetical protein
MKIVATRNFILHISIVITVFSTIFQLPKGITGEQVKSRIIQSNNFRSS